MTLNVGFQADPLSGLKKTRDTSLFLAQEAYARGHKVFFFTPATLQLCLTSPAHSPKLTASGYELFFKPSANTPVSMSYELGPLQLLDLSFFNVLFIRQDPPVDMHYISTTYLLDFLPTQTLVINNPSSLRNAPEKILPFFFPDLMPPTLISDSEKEILTFIKTHKTIVCKSLYNGAGRDIFLLKENDPNCASLLTHLLNTSQTPLLFQKYLVEINQGDTRVLLFDGKILGAYKRFSQEGFRSNEAIGGTLQRYKLSDSDLIIVSRLIPFLKERQILFAGVDLIGPFLTEINVTSPTGLVSLQNLYGSHPQAKIWDSIEHGLSSSLTP